MVRQVEFSLKLKSLVIDAHYPNIVMNYIQQLDSSNYILAFG